MPSEPLNNNLHRVSSELRRGLKADICEEHATKQKSVKRTAFTEERKGEAFNEWGLSEGLLQERQFSEDIGTIQ